MHLHRTLHDLGGNDVIGDVLSHHGHNERPQRQHGAEHKAGMKVSNLYISQVKRKCGIEVGKNLRVATRRMDCLQGNSTTAATDLELVPSPNLPKNEDSRQPQCPEDKESAIVEALKHFKMNS